MEPKIITNMSDGLKVVFNIFKNTGFGNVRISSMGKMKFSISYCWKTDKSSAQEEQVRVQYVEHAEEMDNLRWVNITN